ncbi:MAG: ArsR family transcriptional regulator [Cuniculiplasma sp.]
MTLTEEGNKLAKILVVSGIPRSVAFTLVYTRGKEEVTSIEIEREAGLRQPEVSIAMQWLRRRGWINKRNMKKEGKGRPVHGYRLSKDFDEILEEIIQDLTSQIGEIKVNIQELAKFKSVESRSH